MDYHATMKQCKQENPAIKIRMSFLQTDLELRCYDSPAMFAAINYSLKDMELCDAYF